MNQFAYLFLLMTALFACRKPNEQIPIDANPDLNFVYGGPGADRAYAATQSLDGTFVLAGNTENIGSDRGKLDAWVLKLDKGGGIIWQKTFGGSANEGASSVALTQDGGYIIAGYTYSTDDDVVGNHGDADAWVLKLDKDGNKQWQKTLGGSSGDEGNVMLQRTKGGYVMVGNTGSNDGDVFGQHGAGDAWVVTIKEQ